MNKKIAIIGAKGQLGSDLVNVFSEKNEYTVFPLTHNDIEITKKDSIKKCLDGVSPHILINTAAYVRVNDAETNQIEAFMTNAVSNQLLSLYCEERKIKLIYISTDYVFGLDKERITPYTENDKPGPVNTYGITKLAGEYYIQELCSNFLIVRSSGIFGIQESSGKKGNFIETMVRLAKNSSSIQVVDDQQTSPTYSLDLAKQIILLIDKGKRGIYHVTSKGNCSWYKFAKTIFEITKIPANLKPVLSLTFKASAKRPHYSVLENQRLEKDALNIMQPWEEGLRDYLKEKNYI